MGCACYCVAVTVGDRGNIAPRIVCVFRPEFAVAIVYTYYISTPVVSVVVCINCAVRGQAIVHSIEHAV